MALRITIEIIPGGNESRKRKLAQIEIENDGTNSEMRGNEDVGTYRVFASGLPGEAGWNNFADFKIGPIKRGNYIDTCIDILSEMHSSKIPHRGCIAGRINLNSGHIT